MVEEQQRQEPYKGHFGPEMRRLSPKIIRKFGDYIDI